MQADLIKHRSEASFIKVHILKAQSENGDADIGRCKHQVKPEPGHLSPFFGRDDAGCMKRNDRVLNISRAKGHIKGIRDALISFYELSRIVPKAQVHHKRRHQVIFPVFEIIFKSLDRRAPKIVLADRRAKTKAPFFGRIVFTECEKHVCPDPKVVLCIITFASFEFKRR